MMNVVDQALLPGYARLPSDRCT